MKVKTFFLTALLLCFGSVGFAQDDMSFEDDEGDRNNPGSTRPRIARSFSIHRNIAYLKVVNEQKLRICFDADYGYLTINIVDSSGNTLVNKGINTSITNEASIDISNLPKDLYFVLLKNNNKETLEFLSFEIK